MRPKIYLALLVITAIGNTSVAQILQKNMSSTNGPVYSVYKKGGAYYVGGSFSYVGLNTGYAALTTASKDYPNMNFPAVNGTVYTSLADGSGGWYVGGYFNTVGGVSQSNLAHIKSDNTVDASFTASCNYQVYALCLVGNRLYIGGNFTSVNGLTRNHAAAVNSKTGQVVSTWDPDLNGYVNSIAAVLGADTTLWLGGNFSTVNAGVYRSYLAKVNSTNGNVINGTTNANNIVNKLVTKKDSVFVGGDFTELGLKTDFLSSITESKTQTDQSMPPSNGEIRAIIPDGSGGWYVAGSFTSIGSQSRTYVARLNPDKSVNATFNVANVGGTVYALALDAANNTLYLGGAFGSVAGSARNFLASVNKNTGALQNWDPSANSYVYTLSLSANDVLAGGLFTTVGGKYAYRFAAISKSTGAPERGFVGYNSTVNSIALKNDSVLTGGSYTLSAYYIPYSAKITTTAVVPDINFYADGIIKTVAQDASGNFYIGGTFTHINGVAQAYAAKLNASFQVVTGWAPVLDGEVRSIVLDKVSNTVFIGGGFTHTNGVSRPFISALNISSGANKTFNSSLDNWVYTLAYDSVNARLYAGGAFTTVNGSSTRNRLAKFDANGNLDGTWNPSASGGGSTVERLAVSGSSILAGGSFTTIGATARNYLAKLNNTNGNSVNWATANSYVYALYVDGTTCYVGGYFTQLTDAGGTNTIRNYIGSITISNGNIASFNPNPNGAVFAISKSGSNVYYGGNFNSVNGTARNYLAASSTSNTLQSWNPSPNYVIGYSGSITIDGANNVIVGGNFSGFQEVGRSYASIIKNSTGKLLPWAPVINSTVNCITYSADKIFIGGYFTQVSGSTRNGLAAFNFKGKLQTFDLKLLKTSGNVTVNTILTTPANNIYVGGDFTQALSTARRDFAEATISPLALSATDASPDANVYAISVNGNTILYGGAFRYSNINPRNYLALINGSSGAALPWNPLPDSYVYDITYNYNRIFVVGQFDNVNSAIHTGAAAFNINTGALLSWNPQLSKNNYGPSADLFAVAADSNNVYLGGSFDAVAGTTRINAAVVAATNASLNTWNPGPTNGYYNGGPVRTIAFKSPDLLIAGEFNFCKGAARNNVAMIDSATGLVNASWNPGANSTVYAITGNGNNIYIGGNFNQLAGVTRNALGSVNANTGAITSFDPAVQNGGSQGWVYSLAFDGSGTLYAGGYFNTVKGTTRNFAAALSTSGAGTLQSWNPNANGQVNAIAVSGSNVYLGGQFTTLNGGSTARNYLASVTTAGSINSFNPNLNSYVYALTVNKSGSLYVGGSFTTVAGGGTSRSYLASYDGGSGSLKSWNPLANTTVLGLAAASDTIYIGGYLYQLNGSSRNHLGAVKGTAGTSTLAFDPAPVSAVRSNYIADQVLLTGGDFTTISGAMRGYFAVYKLPGAPAGSVQSSQLSDLRQPLPSQFKVYPNPSSTGIVTLQLNNAIDGKFAITVTSISGEKVFEKAFQSVKGNVILLNLSSLRSGNYIVNVVSDKTNWSTKLVLAR